MKQMRFFLIAVSVVIASAICAIPSYAAIDYVSQVTITNITNNTPYDFPDVDLYAHKNLTNWVFNFPTDKPVAKSSTSPVYLNGVQQNAILGIGINNFDLSYVGAYCTGCNVSIQVSKSDNTHYSIILTSNTTKP